MHGLKRDGISGSAASILNVTGAHVKLAECSFKLVIHQSDCITFISSIRTNRHSEQYKGASL